MEMTWKERRRPYCKRVTPLGGTNQYKTETTFVDEAEDHSPEIHFYSPNARSLAAC